MEQITVLGAGSFGTALGCILARNGHAVKILTRTKEVAESINSAHINPRNFSDFTLPNNLTCTDDPILALKNSSYILHVIPVQHSSDYLSNIKEHINKSTPIISCSKVLLLYSFLFFFIIETYFFVGSSCRKFTIYE